MGKNLLEFKRTEAAFSRLAAIVESSGDAIIGVTLEGIITDWNSGAEKLFGYSAREAIGKNSSILVPPGVPNEVPKLLKKIARGERVAVYEAQRLRKDGRLVVASMRIAPIKNHMGRIIGASTIARDFPEHKRNEEVLKESEATFRRILELAPDAMILINSKGRIRLVNAQTEKLFGYSREELLGQLVDVLLPERFRDAHAVHRTEYFHEPRTRPMGTGLDLYYGRRKNGTEFHAEVSLSPLETEAGILAISAVRDISERKQVEEQLQRLQGQSQALLRSNTDLEQFAYLASHDLVEPLRKIVSYADLLGRRYAGRLDARADKFIAYIIDGTLRMQNLIHDLLTYSKAGSESIPKELVDLTEAVRQTLSNLEAMIRANGAVVTCGALPTVSANLTEMGQLLQNLIGNAIKFRGVETPAIHISAERNNREWVIAVRDNGLGIEPENFERIFGLFQRLQTRAEYPGNGLGLALCKRIVERHGGRIWVESKPGKGSVFRFTIPDQSGSTVHASGRS